MINTKKHICKQQLLQAWLEVIINVTKEEAVTHLLALFKNLRVSSTSDFCSNQTKLKLIRVWYQNTEGECNWHTFILELCMWSASQGLLIFATSHLSFPLNFFSTAGVFGSTKAEAWLVEEVSFSGSFMHTGVEEYRDFRLFDSSRNLALSGGDPFPFANKLLFSFSSIIWWPVI